MTNPLPLADRCEREAPSRELDAEIALAVGWHRSKTGLPPNEMIWWAPPDRPNMWMLATPAFTTSIDAALTLVPKGWVWMTGCNMGEGYFASLATTEEGALPLRNVDVREAQSPALALCAASLRARALSEEAGRG